MAAGDETLRDRSPSLFEQIVQSCLDRLATRPTSPLVLALRKEALDCQHALDEWRTARPTLDARTAMRTRLLALNAKIDAL